MIGLELSENFEVSFNIDFIQNVYVIKINSNKKWSLA